MAIDKISPPGWHIPIMNELQDLCDLVQLDYTVLNLSQIGKRDAMGAFTSLSNELILWSAEEGIVEGTAKAMHITQYTATPIEVSKKMGYAVRFVKDTQVFTEGDTLEYKGEIYRLAKFGKFVITLDNIVVTQYNDDTPILKAVEDLEWANALEGAYCAYLNQESTVRGTGTSILAPEGWHIIAPSDLPSLIQGISFNTISFNVASRGYRNASGTFVPYTNTFKIWVETQFSAASQEELKSVLKINIPQGVSNILEHRNTGLAIRLVKNNNEGFENTLTDIDGNTYDLGFFGGKIFTLQNFKVIHYNDGTPILNITDNIEWSETEEGAYCSFNNEI